MFLSVGNGKDSSLVVYSISTEESSITLRQLWVLCVKDCPSSVADGDHSQQDPATSAASESEAQASDSDRHHPGEKAFYMAEFNPSGNIFAVEEVPYRTTLIHLVSPDGRVMRSVDLMARVGDQDSRPVNTMFISAHHDGMYAIGLEGGRMVLMDAELLQLKKTFKVVRRVEPVLFKTRPGKCLHSEIEITADSFPTILQPKFSLATLQN